MNFFISSPSDDTMVVIGVSNKQMRPREEIESALEDAAQKVALFYGFKARIETELISGSGGFFDFYANSATELHPHNDYEKYKALLQYDNERDVLRTANAVFVRFTYTVPGLKGIEFNSAATNGKPVWTRKKTAIEIPGFLTAVGYAGKQRYIKQAVTKSYESAIVALMASGSSQISERIEDSSNDGAIQRIKETIEGELMNFMILEIWIDPETEGVWTLAVAKER